MILPRNRSGLRLHGGHGSRMLNGMAADRGPGRWTGHGIHRGPGRQCQTANGLGDPVADPDEPESRSYLGKKRACAVKYAVHVAQERFIAKTVINRRLCPVFCQALGQISCLIFRQVLRDPGRRVGGQPHRIGVCIPAGIADQVSSRGDGANSAIHQHYAVSFAGVQGGTGKRGCDRIHDRLGNSGRLNDISSAGRAKASAFHQRRSAIGTI